MAFSWLGVYDISVFLPLANLITTPENGTSGNGAFIMPHDAGVYLRQLKELVLGIRGIKGAAWPILSFGLVTASASDNTFHNNTNNGIPSSQEP